MEFLELTQWLPYIQDHWIAILVLTIQLVTMLKNGAYEKIVHKAASESLRLAARVITDEEKRDKLVTYVNGMIPFWMRPFFNEAVVDELVERAYKLHAKPILKLFKAQGVNKLPDQMTVEQYLQKYLKEPGPGIPELLKAIQELNTPKTTQVLHTTPSDDRVNALAPLPNTKQPEAPKNEFWDNVQSGVQDLVSGQWWDHKDDEQQDVAIKF